MECLNENQFSALLAGGHDEASWLHVSECDACAALFSELVTSSPEAPTARPRFTRERMLGRGPHGITWLAMDEQRQQQVALKVMSATLPPGWDVALREVCALEHPNVAPLLEAGMLDGRPFVTHAVVDGPSLEASLPLPVDHLERVFSQVSAALAWAHHRGVLHGEVCPSNIVLGRRAAQLTDFGLSRVVRSAALDGAVTMRLSWLSPEERAGEVPTARADQYALARSFWVALFGAPFRRDVQRSLVDERLVNALERALSVDPRARFASVTELAEAWR